MANIVIKKKLSLEFLGEDYKDSYLTFKAIPVSKYKEFTDKLKKVEQKDNAAATEVMLGILQESFVDGKFEGEEVTSDNLGDFDGSTILKCFETLTGQTGGEPLDPKDESLSSSQSSTEQNPPTS